MSFISQTIRERERSDWTRITVVGKFILLNECKCQPPSFAIINGQRTALLVALFCGKRTGDSVANVSLCQLWQRLAIIRRFSATDRKRESHFFLIGGLLCHWQSCQMNCLHSLRPFLWSASFTTAPFFPIHWPFSRLHMVRPFLIIDPSQLSGQCLASALACAESKLN